MLETSFHSFISQKGGESSIFETFMAKKKKPIFTFPPTYQGFRVTIPWYPISISTEKSSSS